MSRLKLSELIDLEVQLLRDEQAVAEGRAEEVTRRDRAIGHRVGEAVDLPETDAARHLATDRDLRHEVCRSWLAFLPSTERQTLPGTRIENGYRTIGWLLLVVFFLFGLGSAAAALHSTDEKPINVLVFIVVFFVVQIALLILYPILMLVRWMRGGGTMPWLQNWIVRLSRIKFVDKLSGGSLDSMSETMDQLRTRQSIYGGVQRWMLFSLVQRMATAFNFAALLTSLYMVAFYDLAHSCWSTTLSIEPADLHQWLSWIATPWSFIDGAGAPSLDAIVHSRWVTSGKSGYDTIAGAEGVNAPELRRLWWPFLIAGLITWGLLPRFLAYITGSCLTHRASRRVPLNHMAVQHLFERLFPPSTSWAGPDPETVRGAAPVPKKTTRRGRPKLDPNASCYVVCWGTLFAEHAEVESHVRDRLHRPIEKTLGAGLADVAIEERTLQVLSRAKAGRVVIAMPEGQQPTKDVTRFLDQLRRKLGAQCELVVGILAHTAAGFEDVDSDEMDAWRTKLASTGDPYLSLQPMGSAS